MGLGYVGCVSAACFAEIGHSVLGVDRDLNKVEAVQKAQSPFFEAGLDSLIQRNVASGRLNAGPLDEAALGEADVVMLCRQMATSISAICGESATTSPPSFARERSA
jgi:UDP-glucose 6-dehydrogenase